MTLADQVADVSVTSTTATQSRAGFGTALLLASRVPWTSGARVRTYGGIAAVEAAGFDDVDAVYQEAAVLFAQEPAPTRIKIGQRTRPFSQVIRLTPEAPQVGKVYSLTVDGHDVTYTGVGTDIAVACTGIASAITAANGASATAIIATGGASSASSQTLSGAALNGPRAGGTFRPAKLSLVLSSHADWDATTAVVTGLGERGEAQTESLSIPDGGNSTVSGAKLFTKVTQVVIPAQSGTGGTFTLGLQARFAASGTSTTHVDVSTAVAGVVVAYSGLSTTLELIDHTADAGIADDLTELFALDPDWYGLAVDSNGAEEITAAAQWCETHKRLYFSLTADSGCADGTVTTDVMSLLRAGGYKYTAPWYYPALGLATSQLAAGAMGKHLPTDPGSSTLAFKRLAGVTVPGLSDAAVSAIVTTPDSDGKNGNVYLENLGTMPGMTASGEWIDIVRGLDWLRARLREAVIAVQTGNERIQFTDNGIDLMRAAVGGVLDEAIGVGLLAATPRPVITTPRAANVSQANRAARKLPSVTFSAHVQGAILYTTVRGTVSA